MFLSSSTVVPISCLRCFKFDVVRQVAVLIYRVIRIQDVNDFATMLIPELAEHLPRMYDNLQAGYSHEDGRIICADRVEFV